MSLQLKNATVSNVFIRDVGLTLIASSTYTIGLQEYAIWAGSDDVEPYLTDGSLTVVFEGSELPYLDGLDVLRYMRAGWQNYGMHQVRDLIPENRKLLVPADRQFLVLDALTIEGEVEIIGTLGVL